MKETDMPNTEIYGVTRDIIPRLNWTTVTMQPFLTKWLFQEKLSHMKTKKEWVESYLDDSPIKPAKFCVIAEQPESLIGFWLSKEDMDSFFLNLDRITFHLKDALGVIDVRSESKLIHTFPFVQEDERLWAGLQSLEAYRRQSLDLLLAPASEELRWVLGPEATSHLFGKQARQLLVPYTEMERLLKTLPDYFDTALYGQMSLFRDTWRYLENEQKRVSYSAPFLAI